ncbi:CCAAT-binding factor [Dillenia turbinata]|uniref:CCAAT-binding factor n=1 Tax=Dillenia turbinata TaxID=194707 RepID=A0AAN8VFN6_9MAGN
MGNKQKQKKKQKVILPPDLPPEVSEDEIEVSDEDLQFVAENRDYAGFVSTLDTQSITKHVTRVADLEGDALELLYEERLKKRSVEKETDKGELQVDRVDALPIKTLDGTLYYRTASKADTAADEDQVDGALEDDDSNKSMVKLSKAERRAKLKKSKKEAKKQMKEQVKTEEVQQTPQAEVLEWNSLWENAVGGKTISTVMGSIASLEGPLRLGKRPGLVEVKEDLTAEEEFENKKARLAELGIALLADPEANIRTLKEMLQISKDGNHAIVKLGLLSLLAVFKDIIPGYRIRLPTEKEQEMKVSKAVKKMRFYEATLLSSYKAYLQKLIFLEKQLSFQQVAIRCICTLLETVPHFNFHESLLSAVVKNIGSSDVVVRTLCCAALKSIFTNEGKHGGEATVEAVKMIADHVKANGCLLHPDSIEVFMSLSFDEDLRKSDASNEDSKVKGKKNRKRNSDDNQLPTGDKRRSKEELLSKMREEVSADFKAVSFAPDIMEKRRMQTETLSAVFETYFRILKHTMQPPASSSRFKADNLGAHPLLAPCLNGLGKFSHLIDLDFMGDLMRSLKKLTDGSSGNDSSSENQLTVSERLRCCIVAFKVMRNNLDAINVDLQDFFVQLYNLILEFRPGRDQGEVLAEALKTMLCEGREHDMQRAAAFIKRLATFALCFGSAESLAALVTLKHLLQRNTKCRNMLENDPGGGSVSGLIAKYQPYASDPHLSGALASVLWELNLLSKHYHPAISTMASSISRMNMAHSQVLLSNISPPQAYMDLSIEEDIFNSKHNIAKLSNKKKRGRQLCISAGNDLVQDVENPASEDEIRRRLSEHFTLLRDMQENEKLRSELDQTTFSLKLYEEYKRQKRKKRELPKKMKQKRTVQ